jgi:hypothetical protein
LARFASYIATSAARIKALASSPCSGKRAMPMEAAMSMGWPSITSGSSRAFWIFPATTRAASMDSLVVRSTANSSPPSRATISESRRALRTRTPTSRRAWSPTGWPSVSLMVLNRSMSKTRTDSCWLARFAVRTAWPSCSLNIARFGSAVSPSSYASRRISRSRLTMPSSMWLKLTASWPISSRCSTSTWRE